MPTKMIAGIDYDKLANIVDIHSAFTWEKFLQDGLDAHFNARAIDYPAPTIERKARASKYWTQTDYAGPFSGYLRCPRTNSSISVYTKQAFKYPVLWTRIQLPDLTGQTRRAWWGFENGSYAGNATALWRFDTKTDRLVAGPLLAPLKPINITNLLPSTYKTAMHYYVIEYTKPMAVFYIDNKVVCYQLFTPDSYFTGIAGPPYALVPSRPMAAAVHAMVESVGLGSQFDFPLSPYWFRVSEGDALPPRVIRLYQSTSTNLLAGLEVDPDITSHPFPVWGYEGKTIYFQADGAGTLDIEVLMSTGNWRTYATPAVVADTLLIHDIADNAVLARVVYTPTAAPDTINEAEVVLR